MFNFILLFKGRVDSGKNECKREKCRTIFRCSKFGYTQAGLPGSPGKVFCIFIFCNTTEYMICNKDDIILLT